MRTQESHISKFSAYTRSFLQTMMQEFCAHNTCLQILTNAIVSISSIMLFAL